jgi:hypothetical protein
MNDFQINNRVLIQRDTLSPRQRDILDIILRSKESFICQKAFEVSKTRHLHVIRIGLDLSIFYRETDGNIDVLDIFNKKYLSKRK